MHCYLAYGESLASELPFPELRDASQSAPFWTFRVSPQAPISAAPPGDVLGTQCIYGDCHARLLRTATGLTITVDDTGRYDLTAGGREIAFTPAPGGTLDYARAHLLGRVLSTSMHFEGALVLHGSAVAYPTGAVLFLAPKHTGKSTLALALTMAGGRLISDDTIAVLHPEDERPLVRPGIHSLRLFPDSGSHLLGRTAAGSLVDGKLIVADLSPEQLQEETLPLAAVYLLASAESIDGGLAVGRRPVMQPLAAAAMVGQGKISEMLGPAEAPVLLRRAARVASRVPVYQLAVHHDLARLPEVASRMAEWHGTGDGPV